MLLVPELRAEGVLLEEVNMIEALGGHVALVFDDGAVGSFEVREAGAVGGLNALVLGVGDFRFGAAKRSSSAGPVSLLTKTEPPSSVV